MNTRRYVNLVELYRISFFFLFFFFFLPIKGQTFLSAKIFESGYGVLDISRGAKSTTAPVALALVRSSD